MNGPSLLLHLAGSKGGLEPYAFIPVEPGSAAWALTAAREGGGEPHRVALGRDGVMRCDCKDFYFRRRGKASGCKHSRRAGELYAFLAAYRETTTMADDAVKTLVEALAAPFPQEVIKFRPGVVAGNRAMALAYVDARDVQDRLDAVLGADGWQDQYQFLPEGSVVCTLRVRLRGEWVTKMDVGSPSEQPDEGDRVKASVSDALKRAAVKFGVGRYLYRMPAQWCDYDPQKKRFTRRPSLAPQTQAAKPVLAEDADGLPAQGPPTKAPPPADDSFARCKAALKDAADLILLDRYRTAYSTARGYTKAEIEELDTIYADRFNALGGRKAKPAGKPSRPARPQKA